jgi:hypothetical protein
VHPIFIDPTSTLNHLIDSVASGIGSIAQPLRREVLHMRLEEQRITFEDPLQASGSITSAGSVGCASYEMKRRDCGDRSGSD